MDYHDLGNNILDYLWTTNATHHEIASKFGISLERAQKIVSLHTLLWQQCIRAKEEKNAKLVK